MTLSVSRARGACRLFPLFILPLTSCTSLQWQSADGTLHEVGLVMYSVEESGQSIRLQRISFGATLRLSGPDPGYCVGVYDSGLIVPEYSSHATADDLAESVAQYLANVDQPLPTRKRLGFFSLSHPQVSKAIDFRTNQIGVGFSMRERGGILAGMEQSSVITGPVLNQDAVQIVVRDLERPEFWAARAWTLEEPPLKPR